MYISIEDKVKRFENLIKETPGYIVEINTAYKLLQDDFSETLNGEQENEKLYVRFLKLYTEWQKTLCEGEVIELFGKAAFYTIDRISPDQVPEGLYLSHVRGDDETTGGFCELAPKVLVNHFGSILTEYPIDFGEKGYIEFDQETSPHFTGESLYLFEFMNIPKEISKKQNARYWDEIECTILDCLKSVTENSVVKPMWNAEEIAMDCCAEIRDVITNTLERYGCEFPYIEQSM